MTRTVLSRCRRPAGALAITCMTFSLAWSATATSGAAQSTSVPYTLAGTWTYERDEAHGIRVVDGAFDAALGSIPELLRGLARDRIHDRMRPPRRVEVVLDGAQVRVTIESNRTTVVDTTLGTATTIAGAEGDVRVTPRLRAGWLELHYHSDESDLRQLLSTEPDGTRMHLDYTVESSRLASPVRYRLEYVRAP